MGKFHRLFVPATAALALGACAAGPDYLEPASPPAATGAFIGSASPLVTAAEPQGDWWRLYQDPVLDGLVADALRANTDLRVALANLERARALLREARSQRLPQTSVDASATYGRTAADQRRPGAAAENWVYDAGFSVAYEVDLAGRVKRSIEAARADADAEAAAADAVRVGIVAETARAYAEAAAAAEQIAVAETTFDLLDRTAELTDRRFQAGRTSRLDVSRALALRDQQRATIPSLRAARDAALFRLAFLTGRAPAELPAEAGLRQASLRLDQPIPVGDGRALLARRPDVREAERRLAAQTARIGVATAELYPQITLGGSVGSTSTSLGDVFGAGPLRWLVGPLLSWAFPNLEGGRARVAQAQASTRAALASFDGTVLGALQETETALSAYAHALERREALAAATEQARVAARISRAQLREGRADFLIVLDAERTLAEVEASLAQARAQVAETQIDLFRALGGGWQTDSVRTAAR